VHPFGEKEAGVAMIFNPTDQHFAKEEIDLPLYYTALQTEVLVTVNDAPAYSAMLERDYSVTIRLDLKPKSIHTIVLERPSSSYSESS
jgi:hypothetical protein